MICGGVNELLVSRQIAGACPGVLVASAQLSVMGTAALFEQCQLMVGLDTGTTHLASACGVPAIAIYGQRDGTDLFHPPGDNYTMVQKKVSCSGCALINCKYPSHPCMTLHAKQFKRLRRTLRRQRKKDKNKLYALHAPEVECISKGQARHPYEFGVKASLAITHRQGLAVGAKRIPQVRLHKGRSSTTYQPLLC